MSYCNRAASEALKKIGFDEPTSHRHKDGINGMYIENAPRNHNKFEGEYSAPDHLQAADWLFEKHRIEIAFRHSVSFVFHEADNDVFGKRDSFRANSHRDAAVISACEIVEKRKEQVK